MPRSESFTQCATWSRARPAQWCIMNKAPKTHQIGVDEIKRCIVYTREFFLINSSGSVFGLPTTWKGVSIMAIAIWIVYLIAHIMRDRIQNAHTVCKHSATFNTLDQPPQDELFVPLFCLPSLRSHLSSQCYKWLSYIAKENAWVDTTTYNLLWLAYLQSMLTHTVQGVQTSQ